MSFTCNFFAYFKFHSDRGRVIGKLKHNELDYRDTAPLILEISEEIGVFVVIFFRTINDKTIVRRSF